jgi:hypothetical protein
MSKDPQGGGTNADGSRSPIYCSYCYEGGTFTFTGTVEDFAELCRKAMIANGTPRLMAWLFTRGMKRLPRWKRQRPQRF